MKAFIAPMEFGLLPDALVRIGIRRLLDQRLRTSAASDQNAFMASLMEGPIAIKAENANQQHYEVPAAFFAQVLGPRLKYSSCYWPASETTLAQAENHMLSLTCKRAQLDALQEGQRVLELGCGWGSLSLWMAEHYRHLDITAISNSLSQAQYIRSRAEADGLGNLTVHTQNINDLHLEDDGFDRVVSVEMFEHMRNWNKLTQRVGSWLKPDGKAFVHIFNHKTHGYPFERNDGTDWMERFFFSGGIMPPNDIFRHFGHLAIENEWTINGTHYGRTLRAWLNRQDRSKAALMPLFRTVYGGDAKVWWQRWRVFWIACEELFNFRNGTEWQVSHYLLKPTNT